MITWKEITLFDWGGGGGGGGGKYKYLKVNE